MAALTLAQAQYLLDRLTYAVNHPQDFHVTLDSPYSTSGGLYMTYGDMITYLQQLIQSYETGTPEPTVPDYDTPAQPDLSTTDYFVLSPASSNIDAQGCTILKVRTLEVLPLTDSQVITFQQQGYTVRPSSGLTVNGFASSFTDPISYNGVQINNVQVRTCPPSAGTDTGNDEPVIIPPYIPPPTDDYPTDDTTIPETPSDSVPPIAIGGGLGLLIFFGLAVYLFRRKK